MISAKKIHLSRLNYCLNLHLSLYGGENKNLDLINNQEVCHVFTRSRIMKEEHLIVPYIKKKKYNSYFNTGEFDFSMLKRGKITPDNPHHVIIYKDYQKYLYSIYDNENTILFYEYEMFCVLQFFNRLNIIDLDELQSFTVIQYIKETKQFRQREVLLN